MGLARHVPRDLIKDRNDHVHSTVQTNHHLPESVFRKPIIIDTVLNYKSGPGWFGPFLSWHGMNEPKADTMFKRKPHGHHLKLIHLFGSEILQVLRRDHHLRFNLYIVLIVGFDHCEEELSKLDLKEELRTRVRNGLYFLPLVLKPVLDLLPNRLHIIGQSYSSHIFLIGRYYLTVVLKPFHPLVDLRTPISVACDLSSYTPNDIRIA